MSNDPVSRAAVLAVFAGRIGGCYGDCTYRCLCCQAKRDAEAIRALPADTRVEDLEQRLAEIEAGCDIQKAHGLYRQVPVVIGPGLTADQIKAAAGARLAEAADDFVSAFNAYMMNDSPDARVLLGRVQESRDRLSAALAEWRGLSPEPSSCQQLPSSSHEAAVPSNNPPVPGRVYWFAEMARAPGWYAARRDTGCMTTADPLKARRFESREACAMVCAYKWIETPFVPREHVFLGASPAPAPKVGGTFFGVDPCDRHARDMAEIAKGAAALPDLPYGTDIGPSDPPQAYVGIDLATGPDRSVEGLFVDGELAGIIYGTGPERQTFNAPPKVRRHFRPARGYALYVVPSEEIAKVLREVLEKLGEKTRVVVDPKGSRDEILAVPSGHPDGDRAVASPECPACHGEGGISVPIPEEMGWGHREACPKCGGA